jgi:predicted ABC-type ATPase
MQEKPKLIIIAGPNGSGKTTITNQILEHDWKHGCIYINPDQIAQDKYGDWNNPSNALKAANDALQVRQTCLKNKASLIFETVFSAQDKIDYLISAKEAGYFIRLFFIGTNSPRINASRVAKRVQDGGHDVPIPKIISRYEKSISNCGIIAPLVDRLYIYDNSFENETAKLLFRASDGKFTKQYYPINEWALNIFNKVT